MRPEIDYEMHLVPGSPLICFAFSSGSAFEWGATLLRLGVSHVLVRDGKYYAHRGELGEVVDRFAAMARGYQRSVSLGLSNGSYWALLYGARAGFHEVIAISPVTCGGDPENEDLQSLYRMTARPATVCFISDGQGCAADRGMAERINPDRIILVPGQSHAGLAAHLRDIGAIEELLCPAR